MNVTTLKPGQSVDVANGYVARSYADASPYYAERVDANGDALGLSAGFATFAEALQWIAAQS
jgi:hypothetical protein